MKKWLKSGVIGALVGFFLYLILIFVRVILQNSTWDYPLRSFSQYVLDFCAPYYNFSCGYYYLFLSLILGFIIGALVGLIISKIKTKK